jgi:hypothetical protein
MRNAALVLGVIGGVLALIVGFFGFGYTQFIAENGEVGNLAKQVNNPGLVQAASLVSPILAIAGAAMARSANVVGGILMLVSSVGLYLGFGFNVFTMFPEAMCALGGILALAARQPDPH